MSRRGYDNDGSDNNEGEQDRFTSRGHKRSRSRSRERGRGGRSRSGSRSVSRSRSTSRGRSKSRSPPPRYTQRDRRDDSPTNGKRDKNRSTSPQLSKPRKKGMWDKAPPGYEGMNVAQVASLNPSVLTPLITPTNTLLQSRQARRLYVGNVPLSVGDAEIMEFFNAAMIAAKIVPSGVVSVVGCQMNHEKNYAFIEFRDPEEATKAMAFDGISLQNNILKVRRPKDYVAMPSIGSPPAATSPRGETDESPSTTSSGRTNINGIVATNVTDSPSKIYLGGLPPFLSVDQVKELVSTFGQLKSFHLVMETSNPAMSKGYAFLEYLDDRVTDQACEGLNGMHIGDKTIVMHRANPSAPAKPSDSSSTPSSSQQQQQATSLPAFPSSNPLLTATLLGMPYMGSTAPPPPTCTLLLLNMASVDEIAQEHEYQAMVADVQAECAKLGPVKSVVIPRPAPPQNRKDPPPSMLAKVYVHYEHKEDAYRAHQTLGGRRYNGRTIVSHFVEDRDE